MNAQQTIRQIRLIKRQLRKLEWRLGQLVAEAGYSIRHDTLSVKALAEIDRIQTCWLLREAGLVPSIKEAHARVVALVGKAKPGELRRQREALP